MPRWLDHLLERAEAEANRMVLDPVGTIAKAYLTLILVVAVIVAVTYAVARVVAG